MLSCISSLVIALAHGGGIPQSSQLSSSYVIRPTDVISVVVQRHPSLSGDYFVPTDGIVDLPVVGPTKLVGLDLGTASLLVKENLRKRLRDPEVSITLKVPRSRKASVLGDVKTPGSFELQDTTRLVTLVSQAGGLAIGVYPTDCSLTLITSVDGKSKTVPYTAVLNGEFNPIIAPDDYIAVDSADRAIFVGGKVKSPGQFHLRANTVGLAEALALAGGPLDDASLKTIKVTRRSGEVVVFDYSKNVLPGEKPVNFELKAGDTVLVPETDYKVVVLGTIGKPGQYVIPEGRETRLTEVLALAQGFDSKSLKKRVGVVQIVDGKVVSKVYNVAKFASTADMALNPVIHPGAVVFVPESDKVDLNTILSGITSLALFKSASK